jgi:uncharacterized protein YigE (DUF2233 family)
MLLALLLAAGPGVGFETVEHAGDRFHVVDVDPAKARLRLHWSKGANTTDKVKAEAPDAVALTNAGIFEPGFTPTGLLVIDGKEHVALNLKKGEGNFFMQPNGVFALTNKGPVIVDSPSYPKLKNVELATQSGPLLVHEDAINTQFAPASKNVAIRSAVGVGKNGHDYLVISAGPVRLFSIASLFREKLGCPEALYLDGAISNLWAPALGLTKGGNYEYAAMISVSPR